MRNGATGKRGKGRVGKRGSEVAPVMEQRLAGLEAKAPPVASALLALRQNFGYAVCRHARPENIEAVVAKVYEQAVAGELGQQRLYLDTLAAVAGHVAPTAEDEEELRRQRNSLELAERVAVVLYYEGPQREVPLFQKAGGGAQLPDVLRCLRDCDWFAHEADGWHLTARGRSELRSRYGFISPRE